MPATVTVNSILVDNTQNQLVVSGAIVLTGNYSVASGNGDPLSFVGNGIDIPSSGVPQVEIYEDPPAGTAPTGYMFTFCPGTTQANGLLYISNNLTQYTQNSAYSGPLLAAIIRFRAWFPSLI